MATRWKRAPGTRTRVAVVAEGRRRTLALRLRVPTVGRAGVTSAEPVRTSLDPGLRYAVSAWVRVSRGQVSGRLVAVEHALRSPRVARRATSFRTPAGQWTRVRGEFVATGAGSLDLRLVIKRLGPRQTVVVDDLRVVNPRQVGRRFSNGCGYSKRGISRCSTLVGGAYGANTSPKRWEASIGRHLGVRRTYYGADQINGAVAIARRDLREGRVPWISFKAPHSWADMANGAGDAWARHLARRLATVKGPVWLAIHHEPENDGPIADWTAMQQRLAPLIRSKAPNVAYSIVLTGWNQVAGPRQFHLDSLWPDTTVDLVGFDIYNHYGSTKTGSTEHSPLRARYFRPLSRWAKAHGIAWGLAEAGYTDLAARNDPDWPVQTYRDLKDLGAVAFSYFNTPVNSSQTWPLNDAAKNAWFGRAVRSSPSL